MSRSFDSELSMQKYWNSMDVSERFYTEDNIPLIIRSGGFWNHESGPDFKNAAIKLGDRQLKGDIELHLRASDWHAHQHQHDSAYSNVILHVVNENDIDQEKRESLPAMLVLKPDAECNQENLKGRCADFIYDIGTERARDVFISAGRYRFEEKAKRFTRQILLEGTEQSFWRFLFEAAGYKQNSPAFRFLFKRFLSYPEEIRREYFEDILWGESGLLPDLVMHRVHNDMRRFVSDRWDNWWHIRQHSSSFIKWKSGGRPVNSPERRLAVLVKWMRRFGNTPFKEIAEYAAESSPQELVRHVINKLQVSDELWDGVVNFNTPMKTPARIGGRSFALEVAVNVIFPAVHAMTKFDIFKESEIIAERIEEAWRILPATQENSVTRRAGELWFREKYQKREVLDSAAARQGLIHIYREYCEKIQSDCNSCKWQ